MRMVYIVRNLILASMLTTAVITPSLAGTAPQPAPAPAAATDNNSLPVPYIANEATQTVPPPPEVTQPNGVRYISGGISVEERDALEPLKHNYNLWISSSTRGSGAYHGSTHISILGKDGGKVLDVHDVGPLFYAALPPGAYTVEASSDGKSASQKVTVSDKKPAAVDFHW